MKKSISLTIPHWKHLLPEQVGVIVAYLFRLPECEAVHVSRIGVQVALSSAPAEGFETRQLVEIQALLELDPLPCPCGCGVPLVLAPCAREQDEQLTPRELEMAQSGHKIHAIKSVRDRTGWGLKQAKELVDRFVPYPPAGYSLATPMNAARYLELADKADAIQRSKTGR